MWDPGPQPFGSGATSRAVQTEPMDGPAPKSSQSKHRNPGRRQEGSPGIVWKPHKNAFPTHNFTHLQRFSSSVTIFDFVKYFSSWNCQPGLFSQGFMEELVISGGLAALGALEPVLGVQGRGRCDSQHGRQGNHFPKKSKVSSVSANPVPGVTHEAFTGRSSLRNNPGCHGTTTQQTLGHLWWPRPALPQLA